MSPARRRDAVRFLVKRRRVSERRACRVVGQHRSTNGLPRPSNRSTKRWKVCASGAPSSGARADIVCGFLYSQDPLFDPALKAFPPAFVVRPPPGPARAWFDASIAYALEESSGERREMRSTRLAELLLIEVLRLHLASAPAADRGWLAALRDPLLAPAMKAIHTAPGRKWTVGDLAKEAAVSRSLLDSRFRDVLGLSPIRYLNGWRMRIAQDLLATTEVKVAAVASRVGYDSEEAFSRAFKRAHGQSPSQWRAGPLASGPSDRAHAIRPATGDSAV